MARQHDTYVIRLRLFFLNLSNDSNFSPSKGNSLQWLIIFNSVDFLYLSTNHLFPLELHILVWMLKYVFISFINSSSFFCAILKEGQLFFLIEKVIIIFNKWKHIIY